MKEDQMDTASSEYMMKRNAYKILVGISEEKKPVVSSGENRL
jgi:hypothetical protein